MANKIVLLGKRFGRLKVIGESERPAGVVNTRSRWICICDCGRMCEADSGNLRNGVTKSCGCLRREVTSQTKMVHGDTVTDKHTPEYRSWHAMKQRCNNPRNVAYKYYGGRGIMVCVRWMDSFQNFLKDMGRKPGPKFTIERNNNNLGYSPDNCKWATSAEQNQNKRKKAS